MYILLPFTERKFTSSFSSGVSVRRLSKHRKQASIHSKKTPVLVNPNQSVRRRGRTVTLARLHQSASILQCEATLNARMMSWLAGSFLQNVHGDTGTSSRCLQVVGRPGGASVDKRQHLLIKVTGPFLRLVTLA